MEEGAHPTGEALLAGPAQLTYAAVLFVDICDSSRLSQGLGEENTRRLLKAFGELAQQVIPRHGGSIARIQYDGLLALFGHPQTREDAARRAVEAALELRDEAARVKVPGAASARLRLHSGMDFGLVLVSEGDILRGQYDVIGLPSIAAARLCSLAGPDEVCGNEQALGRKTQRAFRFTTSRGVSLKGLYNNIDVLHIQGWADDRLDPQSADDSIGVPFIGRQDAIQALLKSAERARAGDKPVAVKIWGEAGIGKSRLMTEFCRRLDTSAIVLQGSCEQTLDAVPLQAFLQAIRIAFGRNVAPGAVLHEAAAGMRLSAVRTVLDQQALKPKPSELVPAILEVATLLAPQQMLVLILDDWQWADDASHETLRLILERPLKALVIVASRPDPAHLESPPADVTITLEGLDDRGSDEAVRAYRPGADWLLVDEIARKSGGNPLFIEELCHAAARNELAALKGVSGPPRLNGLVISRVAQLPPQDAAVLRTASVLGASFPAWLLQRVVAAQDLDAALRRLAAADFLLPAPEAGYYRFKHVLTREAVYTTVTDEPRIRLHRRAAQAVVDSAGAGGEFDWLETLAYHYAGARDHENAARYARAAGDKALGASALDRARLQYIAALRALDELPELSPQARADWCAIARRLGEACVFDPLDIADGLRLFERALELARELQDPVAIGHAEYWLAYISYARGRPRDAVRHSEQAMQFAEQAGHARLKAQAIATLGQSLASAGQYTRALERMEEALRRKREQSGPTPGSHLAIGSAYTLARKGYTLADMGRFDESDEAFAQSLHLLGDTMHSVAASVFEVKCVAHLWQGRWDDAAEAARRGHEIALRCRSRWMVAMGQALAACGRWSATEDPEALNALREWTDWIEQRGGAVSTSLNYGWLVEACVATGNLPDARRYAARLFARARLQDRHGEAMGCRALARAAAHRGDLERARYYLRRAQAVADYRTSVRERALNLLAEAEVAAPHDRSGAVARASAAAETFESLRMPWHVERARAVLQQH